MEKETTTYRLSMSVNDEKFECETDNLKEAILSFKPAKIKTKVLFHIEQGNKFCDKIVMVPKARMLFNNKTWLEAFIKQLIFKNG